MVSVANIEAEREWVNCPICGEPDMRADREEDGWLVSCVNLGCPSNQIQPETFGSAMRAIRVSTFEVSAAVADAAERLEEIFA